MAENSVAAVAGVFPASLLACFSVIKCGLETRRAPVFLLLNSFKAFRPLRHTVAYIPVCFMAEIKKKKMLKIAEKRLELLLHH